jgi:hypothetical protein
VCAVVAALAVLDDDTRAPLTCTGYQEEIA